MPLLTKTLLDIFLQNFYLFLFVCFIFSRNWDQSCFLCICCTLHFLSIWCVFDFRQANHIISDSNFFKFRTLLFDRCPKSIRKNCLIDFFPKGITSTINWFLMVSNELFFRDSSTGIFSSEEINVFLKTLFWNWNWRVRLRSDCQK